MHDEPTPAGADLGGRRPKPAGSTREADIRLILDRGYNRLRMMHNQGREVQGAERLLNLMRDLRVVPFDGMTIKIPLVYAEVWKLKSRVYSYLKRRNKKFVTMFAHSDSAGCLDPAEKIINDTLVNALNNYLWEYKRYGLLLDIMHRQPPSHKNQDGNPVEADIMLLQSEVRGAFYKGAPEEPHPLFNDVSSSIPELLLEVQALVRIIFPLDLHPDGPRQTMGSIIIGIAVQQDGGRASDGSDPSVLGQVRQLADVLVHQVPVIYRHFENPRPARAQNGHRKPPLSGTSARRERELARAVAGDPERKDEIYSAIDVLHKQISDLAYRLDLKGWRDPSQGYNFLIAFRTLEENNKRNLEDRLRYRLTRFNRAALAQNITQGELLKDSHYDSLSHSVEGLFAKRDLAADEVQRRDYVRRSREMLREALEGKTDAKTLTGLVKRIEDSYYPIKLTPGYHVMSLGYPEIVKNWLRDPRAKGFGRYPPLLLAWESLAIPHGTELYYSPIADWSIHFGVCGVKTELLYRGGGPELQELIDNSGSWLRESLSNDFIYKLKNALFQAKASGTTGINLWEEALWHFRQLSYCYLPGGDEFFTMLISKEEASEFDRILKRRRATWTTGDVDPTAARNWKELKGRLSEEASRYLCGVRTEQPGLPDERKGVSFLAAYLRENPEVGDALLYTVKLVNASHYRLLVLVPGRRYQQRMRSLLSRFSMACETALSSYSDDDLNLMFSASEISHQFVYLMPLLRDGLTRCEDGPVNHVRLISEVLQNEMNYFANKVHELRRGEPLTLVQLFDLMSEVTDTIRWGLGVVRSPNKGYLEAILPENVDTLEAALADVRKDASFSALAGRSIGISRSAALLLMWETAFNLCRHSDANISFTLAAAGETGVALSIESGSKTTLVQVSGRYGVTQLQRVANLIGVRFNCGPLKLRRFRAEMEFKQEVNGQ
jgi:hypothetical protein